MQKSKLSASEKILHDQFCMYGLRAKEWKNKCMMLLPKIERQKIWQKRGFTSIYEYAAKIAGLSRLNVDEALRVLYKAADKPALLAIAEQKGINAIKPVVTIATQQSDSFWADKAAQMSKNTLEVYVREIRKGNTSQEGNTWQDWSNLQIRKFRRKSQSQEKLAKNGSPNCLQNSTKSTTKQDALQNTPKQRAPHTTTITMELPTEIAAQLQKLKAQGSWAKLMQELLGAREEKFERKKPAVKTNHANIPNTRYIPAAIKNYIIKKTNGMCAFPGCIKPYNILHHTMRFGLVREHDHDTLHPLCTEHERLAHLGLIENEQDAPARWRVKMQPEIIHPGLDIDRAVQKFRNQTAVNLKMSNV